MHGSAMASVQTPVPPKSGNFSGGIPKITRCKTNRVTNGLYTPIRYLLRKRGAGLRFYQGNIAAINAAIDVQIFAKIRIGGHRS